MYWGLNFHQCLEPLPLSPYFECYHSHWPRVASLVTVIEPECCGGSAVVALSQLVHHNIGVDGGNRLMSIS